MSEAAVERATLHRFNDLFRREHRTFLQYLRDAEPYAAPDDRPWVQRLRQFADAEREVLQQIAQHMLQHHWAMPYLGAFPMAFTGANYLSIRSLLPRVIAGQRQSLAELETDLTALTDLPSDLLELLRTLAQRKREHLEALEKLAN